MSNEVVSTLRKAADLLESKGWTQGAFARNGHEEVSINDPQANCFCVLGAIIFSNCIGDLRTRAALARYLNLDRDEWVLDWNDDPTRTKEEVIKTLRDCADSLETVNA